MKRVFSSMDQVAHVWASQSQSEGRASGAAIYFEGERIYSYGSHYLAAKLYKVKGKTVALVNEYRYSSSTCKHLGAIRRAVRHLPSLSVINPSNPKQSLAKYHADLATQYFSFFSERASRYVMWSTGAESWDSFEGSVDEFNSFCDLFDSKSLKINLTALQRALWIEHRNYTRARFQELNSPEEIAKRDAKREKREAAKDRLAQAKLSDALAIWKAGGERRADLNRVAPQQIRIKGDMIETTGGASVTLDDAKALFKRIKLGKAKEGDRVGPYAFDRVEDGRVVIGCHSIMLSEAEALLGEVVSLKLIQGGAK